jgi:hypothetical protein
MLHPKAWRRARTLAHACLRQTVRPRPARARAPSAPSGCWSTRSSACAPCAHNGATRRARAHASPHPSAALLPGLEEQACLLRRIHCRIGASAPTFSHSGRHGSKAHAQQDPRNGGHAQYAAPRRRGRACAWAMRRGGGRQTAWTRRDGRAAGGADAAGRRQQPRRAPSGWRMRLAGVRHARMAARAATCADG